MNIQYKLAFTKEEKVQVYASINQIKINQLKVACSSSVNKRHNWNR